MLYVSPPTCVTYDLSYETYAEYIGELQANVTFVCQS